MIESAAELAAAVERTVRSRYRSSPLLEDAIQEGLIEAWRRVEADETYGHALQGAIWRAGDVVVGKRQLGAPERSPGSGSRLAYTTSHEARVEALGDSAAPAVEFDPERAAFVDDVLTLLEPVERFIVEAMMAGYNHGDIADALDRSVGAVRKRMPKIRQKLTPALEDLRAA